MTAPNGSWRPDPEGRYEYRWHDGQRWTDQVSHQGQVGRAPLGGPPPGAPQGQARPQGGPQQAQPQATAMGQPPGDGFAGISGDLVDGRFSEKEAKPIANQNSKLLRVRLGEPFMARQGSMVAYQGNVDFAFEGGGASKFIKKALTGEGLPLMRCQGQGDVFLADRAYDVHLLNLSNSGLSISGKNVLAFSSSLDWNIERVKGGSIATGGLFNTTLRGTGWVALTTDGPPVVLNAAEAPTFADTNAVVAWSANLQTQLKTSFKAGALIGRGSGEAVQVSFYGQGFVIVQPSEGVPQVATQ
ncbi:AIM24 family protein [Mycobacterium sp. B14F4]|uniref:AIM24 family protein n=1 Tax=Mycobacterium sp. B14F4 TaxID=3153565 RepID=UPI00325EDD3A